MLVNKIKSGPSREILVEVGRAFVEYIYTGKLDKDIIEKEVISFLELGDKYQVAVLKELAEEELDGQPAQEGKHGGAAGHH